MIGVSCSNYQLQTSNQDIQGIAKSPLSGTNLLSDREMSCVTFYWTATRFAILPKSCGKAIPGWWERVLRQEFALHSRDLFPDQQSAFLLVSQKPICSSFGSVPGLTFWHSVLWKFGPKPSVLHFVVPDEHLQLTHCKGRGNNHSSASKTRQACKMDRTVTIWQPFHLPFRVNCHSNVWK